MSWQTRILGENPPSGGWTEQVSGILGTHKSSHPGIHFNAASKLDMGHASGWPLTSYLRIYNSHNYYFPWPDYLPLYTTFVLPTPQSIRRGISCDWDIKSFSPWWLNSFNSRRTKGRSCTELWNTPGCKYKWKRSSFSRVNWEVPPIGTIRIGTVRIATALG